MTAKRSANPSRIKPSPVKRADFEGLASEIKRGNRAALAQGITLVESTNPEHLDVANSLIEACMIPKPNSLRIGITGVPGVGKSTFIESFGSYLTGMGKKVAVLAVDPTSTLSKGSIMGDKTRMPELATDPMAFIRPSPAGSSLGGVARKTREAIILCEAAGYDLIIIETVGVGQSEIAVHSMVDFFLLLKISGAGDELQGIKRGIMEMADAVVITKADGSNIADAELAMTEFRRALQLYPPKANGWQPKVMLASALEGTGIEPIAETVFNYQSLMQDTGELLAKRARQNIEWMEQTLNTMLADELRSHKKVNELIPEYEEKVAQNRMSPFRAAEALLLAYRNAT